MVPPHEVLIRVINMQMLIEHVYQFVTRIISLNYEEH